MAKSKNNGNLILKIICAIFAYMVFSNLFLLNYLPVPHISVITILMVIYFVWANWKNASVLNAIILVVIHLVLNLLLKPIVLQFFSAFTA